MQDVHAKSVPGKRIGSRPNQVLHQIDIAVERAEMECREFIFAFRPGVYPLLQIVLLLLIGQAELAIAVLEDMLAQNLDAFQRVHRNCIV